MGIDDHHLRLLSLKRKEALLPYRINYEFNNNVDGGDNHDVDADGEDEVDGYPTV